MNPRLAWLIFRKDARRWWWIMALTLLLLGRLTWLDAGRHYVVTGSEDSWLYLLLPFAWSLLIALTVMEDPALGDGPFWMTLPCGWRPVLAAKAMFAMVFIHLPYLAGCAAIVQARGFSPFECVPELLYKQAALAALTIPSLALACVVRNAAQFAMIAIALETAVAAPSTVWDRPAARDIRAALLILAIAIAGGAIARRQYRLRLTTQARWIGGAALALAAAIWWLPQESFYGLASAVFPPPSGTSAISIRYAGSARHATAPVIGYGPLRVIWIPIETGGYPGGIQFEQA
ncbi:MAG TPA: hypothetical protein VFT60_12680, partial [Bryobacteraceae bacterium]|nr:hypothetical protein [Bryobacteraceae bacterium]